MSMIISDPQMFPHSSKTKLKRIAVIMSRVLSPPHIQSLVQWYFPRSVYQFWNGKKCFLKCHLWDLPIHTTKVKVEASESCSLWTSGNHWGQFWDKFLFCVRPFGKLNNHCLLWSPIHSLVHHFPHPFTPPQPLHSPFPWESSNEHILGNAANNMKPNLHSAFLFEMFCVNISFDLRL